MGRAFVPMGRIKSFVRNVVGPPIVNMTNRNVIVRNVVGRAFVPMGNGNVYVRNVTVEICARPQIVQP